MPAGSRATTRIVWDRLAAIRIAAVGDYPLVAKLTPPTFTDEVLQTSLRFRIVHSGRV